MASLGCLPRWQPVHRVPPGPAHRPRLVPDRDPCLASPGKKDAPSPWTQTLAVPPRPRGLSGSGCRAGHACVPHEQWRGPLESGEEDTQTRTRGAKRRRGWAEKRIHCSTPKKYVQLSFIAFHFNEYVILSCLQASDYPDGRHSENQRVRTHPQTLLKLESPGEKQKPDLRQKKPPRTDNRCPGQAAQAHCLHRVVLISQG